MLNLALSIVPFLFSLLVLYGALSDLSTFRIPNWVSYGLIGLFAVYSFLTWLNTPFMPSLEFRLPPVVPYLIIGLFVFVVSTIFWKLRLIGGGDVKYLTATSLWMGPGLFLIFVVLLTGLALVMVAILKFLRFWNPIFLASRMPDFFKRLLEKVGRNELPYGFPIGLAALAMIPSIFHFGQ
jgi:prepilin peptidase CpaA